MRTLTGLLMGIALTVSAAALLRLSDDRPTGSPASSATTDRSSSPLDDFETRAARPPLGGVQLDSPIGFTRGDEEAVPDAWRLGFRNDAFSTEGRPVHYLHLGDGPQRIMLVAGMAGNDRATIELLDSVVAQLSRGGEWAQRRTLLLVRALNPDGLAAGRRFNSRGVDLNHNLPTRRYAPSPVNHTGPGPASEVETQLLLRLLYEFRPSRVIRLASAAGEPAVSHNSRAGALAGQLVHRFACRPQSFARASEGSLEAFVDETLQAESLVLALPADRDPNRRQRLAQIIRASLLDNLAPNAAVENRHHAETTTPALPVSERPPSGYVELPPPE